MYIELSSPIHLVLAIASGPLLLIYLTVRHFRRQQQRRAPPQLGGRAVRFHGEICDDTWGTIVYVDRGEERPLHLPCIRIHSGGQIYPVVIRDTVVDGGLRRRDAAILRVGDKVTVDGNWAQLRQNERLYRDSETQAVIDAVRIIRISELGCSSFVLPLVLALCSTVSLGAYSLVEGPQVICEDICLGPDREVVFLDHDEVVQVQSADMRDSTSCTTMTWCLSFIDKVETPERSSLAGSDDESNSSPEDLFAPLYLD